jgi:hypothetical protein
LSTELSRDQLNHERWSSLERVRVSSTEKHRSIVDHFVEGRPWAETPLFRDIYERRIASGETVRGCRTIAALVGQYESRVDALHDHMRAHGYQRVVQGRETIPIPVYIARDGEILTGNQGNHRLAIAQLLGLDYILVEVIGRHPDNARADLVPEPYDGPELPASAMAIPAMTTEAERLCYYRLTKVAAHAGAVVELGTWLGASTAYIAAGVRDSGAQRRAEVYDRFVWKPSAHEKKAGRPLETTQLEAFKQNLGPLLEHVNVHAGELRGLRWSGEPVSLLVCDAPKRIPEISSVLTTFAKALQPGALVVWQDFAYFPSYDIASAMMRLGDHLELVEAVYPGTTAVFRVVTPWTPPAVSQATLALRDWTPPEVEKAWRDWTERLPEPMQPRFACGAAMFLCDLGDVGGAVKWLQRIVDAHPDEVLPKWRYLIAERAELMRRYRPLVEVVQRCA